ncbi:MAG: sigma-70 family RNA polymerase sigma factor [Planctomycetes bacterium]|nr:sigma-70 family RNA polymerase sigma factor [Planctomycetota bacterium]
MSTDRDDLTSIHVRRALTGDGASLEWVIRRLAPPLLAVARYRIGRRLQHLCDPEDLVDEAWLVTLPRLGEIDPRDGRYTPVLLKYLSSIIVHRVNSLLHRRASQRADDEASKWRPSLAPDEATGAVTRAVRNEQFQIVLKTIDELPEADREVLLLRGVEQRPLPSVAAELGVAPGTAAVRYHRALLSLRRSLPGSFADELADE